MRISAVNLLLLALLILGYGCTPPPPLHRDWKAEQGLEALLQLGVDQFGQVQDLTAEAGISLRRGDGEDQGTALIQFRQPDLLRVEVRGPLYRHIFTVLLQGDSLLVHAPEAGGNWRGTVEGPLLSYLTGLDLRFYDLRHALLGVVETGHIDSSGIVYTRADRAVVPLRIDGGGTRRLWVDLYRGLVSREEIELPGKRIAMRRLLSDYRAVGGLFLPGRVVIEQEDVILEMEYRRFILDRGIEVEQLFQGLPLEQMQWVD